MIVFDMNWMYMKKIFNKSTQTKVFVLHLQALQFYIQGLVFEARVFRKRLSHLWRSI